MRPFSLFTTSGALLFALGFTACRSPEGTVDGARPAIRPVAGWEGYQSPEPSARTVADADPSREAMSYYERRLIDVTERKTELERRVRENPEVDTGTVQRQFREIASEYQSLIADNPNQLEARLLYGKFLDFFGDRDGASEQFIQALNIDPDAAVAYQQLGNYFAERGDFGKALAYYLNAIERDPDEPIYHHGLGEMLLACKEGFLDEAGFNREQIEEQMLEAFRRAAELEPDSLVFQFRYGEAFYDLYDPDWTVALAHWERLGRRSDLSPLQADVVKLHEARCLGELERYTAARQLAAEVNREGLEATKSALLEAIDEAENRPASASSPPAPAS